MRDKSEASRSRLPIARLAGCVLLAVFSVTSVALGEEPASVASRSQGAQTQSAELELITDRPDQTESSVVVPTGYVQIEFGWSLVNDEDAGTKTEFQEAPGTLVRIGVMDRVELRLGWVGNIDAKATTGAVTVETNGAGDAELGAKFYMWEQDGWKPEAALLVGLSLPAGDDAFTSDQVDPNFRFSFAHTLSEKLSVGYNLGLSWATELDAGGEPDTMATFQYTAVLGIGITDRFGAFVEVYGDVPINAAGGPQNSFDGGITFLLRDNLQFDINGGVGLSDDADDWFFGVGVTVRLPR